jgi:16S rRNA (uracil1498-N3)-methyltransferase
MSERYFVDRSLAEGQLTLDGPEAHHLAVVCRAQVGDQVDLFNGDGCEYPATVKSVSKRAVLLELAAPLRPQRELGFPVIIAAPVPKGDRAQFLIEKLTELGATRFIPLQTQHTVVQPGEAKLEKLSRYVIEASKQCGRNVLMQIAPKTTWNDLLAHKDLPGTRLVAHPGADAVPLIDCHNNSGSGAGIQSGVVAAVGPEGGLTDAEVSAARLAGWRAVSLGRRILRVETAALALATWASLTDSRP